MALGYTFFLHSQSVILPHHPISKKHYTQH